MRSRRAGASCYHPKLPSCHPRTVWIKPYLLAFLHFGNAFNFRTSLQFVQEWLVVVNCEDCAIGLFRQLNCLRTSTTTEIKDFQSTEGDVIWGLLA